MKTDDRYCLLISKGSKNQVEANYPRECLTFAIYSFAIFECNHCRIMVGISEHDSLWETGEVWAGCPVPFPGNIPIDQCHSQSFGHLVSFQKRAVQGEVLWPPQNLSTFKVSHTFYSLQGFSHFPPKWGFRRKVGAVMSFSASTDCEDFLCAQEILTTSNWPLHHVLLLI